MSHIELNEVGIEELFSDPAGPVGRIIEQKAYQVEAAAKALVLLPGSGRLYTQGTHYAFQKNGKFYAWTRTLPDHRASSPGMPPASDTGTLLGSIGHELKEGATVYANVFATAFYAIYLEKGTSLMAPRPFLEPALAIGMAL